MDTLLNFIANILYSIASNSINSTCLGPSYQFKEPKQLKKMK